MKPSNRVVASLVTALTLASVASAARADEDAAAEEERQVQYLAYNAQNLYYGDGGGSPTGMGGGCIDQYDKLHAAHVPDSRKLTLHNDIVTPKKKFTSGETITVGEIKAICDAALAASNLKDVRDKAITFADFAWLDLPTVGQSENNMTEYLEPCVDLWQAALDAGVSPDEQVKLGGGVDSGQRVHSPDWFGRFGDIKPQVCDKAQAAYDAALAKVAAPYKKAGLKNDKLDMALQAYPGGWWIPGGNYDDGDKDPVKLMKANVWFSISEGDECSGGKTTYYFKRFQFDKNQKIAKTTQREYCGDPGRRAVR